ncbi:NAD-dependent DNA ligase LigA [Buchnera aphidicola]|uniref:DNA ligase n=1 Tax=Buchnera aphidicola subsp. Cinara cedri (strain Cc) TaxID=372461 RepID=DNLJ_BUCCC|nr:NAD-dependent DNA ligase LigA [Buchnera aphidicola]Q058C9.1 RecName: Full=DNA ligase; AltName: Full=Polydeoxyribonucleotide synthase [NAD(+)] [Buchnera aphidicola BCc]ABJ90520.1 DNA ligase [Buchnera aphidicola BCc]
MKDIYNQILKLQLQIKYHNYMYHTLDSPIISDILYDELYNKLLQLEKLYFKKKSLDKKIKLLDQVGAKKLHIFTEFFHKIPMLSLRSINNISDFDLFDKKIKEYFKHINVITYFCDFKFDGLAVNLFYKNGILISASTRGNGSVGENITKNILMISSIPKKIAGSNIPKKIEIRGEIFMRKSDFFILNQSCKLSGKKEFSNPRNAAAGSVRQLNPEIVKKRKLNFFVYGFGLFDYNKKIDSHYQRLLQIKKWGFPLYKNYCVCKNKKEVIHFYHYANKIRSQLDFEIDGIVIKLDSIKLQNNLGCIEKYPKWAIALKFFSLDKETKIFKISFKVGRTGIITPVAYFFPINLFGVSISKASLYNIKTIKLLDIRLHDYVTVYRAGDVIPKIRNVLIHKRNKYTQKIIIPTYCPSCCTKLIFSDDLKTCYCPASFSCFSQNVKRLIYFSSKNGLNFKGLGKKNIIKLINYGYLYTPIDFFSLTVKKLKNIFRMGDKLSEKIIKNIAFSKRVSLDKFICSLGIFGVGTSIAKRLAYYYRSVEKFFNTNYDTLSKIDHIGYNISNAIISFLKNKSNRSIILKLIRILNIFI